MPSSAKRKPLAGGTEPKPQTVEERLAEQIGAFREDPEGFVLAMFPWGVKGTRLENESGPDKWQSDVLRALGADLRQGTELSTAIKIAVASGHGIGKTALVAWIIHWFASCFPFNQTVVTANTKTQLLTKTWRELAKWNRLATNAHWFEWTATQYKHRHYPDSWFASAIPWSEHASEAFAGTHEQYVLILFDEASLIADKIWEVTEGAMTTPSALWFVFGNPTRNTGRFAECFGRLKHRWRTWQIDSRTAKKANRAQIQQWIDDYGEDSDFVRVRVRGIFPRAGSMQFIPGDLVTAAMGRTLPINLDLARVMGVDVARHGDDQSCVVKRQGQIVQPVIRYRIPDLMLLGDKVHEDIEAYDPDAIFIDVTGMGWGLYDYLRRKGYGERVFAVQVGEAAIKDKLYFNKRAEVWSLMRDWLKAGACLPDDRELESDLTGIEYGYDARERVQMEKKEDMKKRGLASPDSADGLAITFASHANPRPRARKRWQDRLRSRGTDLSPQAA